MNLGAWFISLAGPAIRKVLASLGIGLVSYAALITALNSALGSAKSAFGGLGGESLSIIQLGGFPEALSVIAGALIARASMQALKKFEVI